MKLNYFTPLGLLTSAFALLGAGCVSSDVGVTSPYHPGGVAGNAASAVIVSPSAKAANTNQTSTNVSLVFFQYALAEGREAISRIWDGSSGADVRLILRVAMPGAFLTDSKHSFKITSFTDDKGTVLKTPSEISRPSSFDFAPTFRSRSASLVGRDNATCFFAVTTDRMPAPNAHRIALKGQALLHVGTEVKSDEAKAVALVVGQVFSAGGMDFRVSNLSEATYSERGGLLVTFLTQSTEKIKGLSFTDSEGREMAATFSSRSTSRSPGLSSPIPRRLPTLSSRSAPASAPGRSVPISAGAEPLSIPRPASLSDPSTSTQWDNAGRVTYILPVGSASANIKVEYFGEIETVEIPIDLEFALPL